MLQVIKPKWKISIPFQLAFYDFQITLIALWIILKLMLAIILPTTKRADDEVGVGPVLCLFVAF